MIINGKFLCQKTTGVQRYARGIAAYFHEIEIIKPSSKSSFQQIFWEQKTLPSLALKTNELLINFCNTAPFWYKNQVVTIHDMAVFENPNWFKLAFANYYQRLFKALAKNARHFVTVSEFSKQEMIQNLKINPDKISVIHSAPQESWKHVETLKPAGKSKKPFLLMVGSHDPRKNFDFVAQNIKNWLAKNDFELIIVGNPGSAFSKFSQTENAQIKWLQNMNDEQLKWLYKNCELLIHPAIYEGFSLVPVEALALGVKSLVSDIQVHREILGVRANYFALNEPEDLIVQLESCINQPKHASNMALYSFEKSAENWRDLLHKLQ